MADGQEESKQEIATFDDAAMMKLLYANYERLLAVVRRNLPMWMDRFVDPEDVLQGAYVRAFASLDTFKYQGDGSDFRWLATITKHHLLNLIEFHRAARRNGDATQVPWPDSSESAAAALLYVLRRGQKSPGQIAADREGIARIHKAMANLHPAEFRAVQLRFVEGHGVDSTARMIDRTPRAVHQLCYRGMRKLCGMLRGSTFDTNA